MKFNFLCAVGVAGLALQASAAPFRVITLTPLPNNNDPAPPAVGPVPPHAPVALEPHVMPAMGMPPVPPFHVGFAGAHYHDPARAEKQQDEEERFWRWMKHRPGVMAPEEEEAHHEHQGKKKLKHGGRCHRKTLARKLTKLMNKFWAFFGFSQDKKTKMGMEKEEHRHPHSHHQHEHAEHHHSEEHHSEMEHHWGPFRPGAQHKEAEAIESMEEIHFMPIIDENGAIISSGPTREPDSRWPMPFRHPGHHRFHNHRGWHNRPFHQRVMHALFVLGPVEGRIVAFVLGLGIGALIRVFYLVGLLAYRSMSGKTRRIMLVEEDEGPLLEHVVEVVVREKEAVPAYSAEARPGEQTVAPSN